MVGLFSCLFICKCRQFELNKFQVCLKCRKNYKTVVKLIGLIDSGAKKNSKTTDLFTQQFSSFYGAFHHKAVQKAKGEYFF